MAKGIHLRMWEYHIPRLAPLGNCLHRLLLLRPKHRRNPANKTANPSRHLDSQPLNIQARRPPNPLTPIERTHLKPPLRVEATPGHRRPPCSRPKRSRRGRAEAVGRCLEPGGRRWHFGEAHERGNHRQLSFTTTERQSALSVSVSVSVSVAKRSLAKRPEGCGISTP